MVKVDIEAIKAKIAALNEKGGNNKKQGNVDFWLSKPGEYTIRCLHWPQGVCRDGEFAIERFFYKNICGQKKILAPEQFEKEDPIKDLRIKLFASGSPSDKELAKKLFARMMCYVPVVVLAGPDANPEKPLVWAFGTDIYKKLLGYFMNAKVLDYFDPKNGFNLTVKSGKQGDYYRQEVELDALTGRCPLADSDEKIAEIISRIPDMSNFWKLKDAQTLSKELNDWLKGDVNVNVEKDSAGTAKEPPAKAAKANAADELDDLVNEVKKETKTAEKKVVKPKKEEPKDDVKPAVSDDLDAAFAELMSEDE